MVTSEAAQTREALVVTWGRDARRIQDGRWRVGLAVQGAGADIGRAVSEIAAEITETLVLARALARDTHGARAAGRRGIGHVGADARGDVPMRDGELAQRAKVGRQTQHGVSGVARQRRGRNGGPWRRASAGGRTEAESAAVLAQSQVRAGAAAEIAIGHGGRSAGHSSAAGHDRAAARHGRAGRRGCLLPLAVA